MVKPRKIAPLALLAVAVGLVWTWQWLDYRAYARAEAAAQKSQAELILAAAEGALHGQCRFRDTVKEDLAATLDEVRVRVAASYLAVRAADGTPFVAAGVPGGEESQGFRKRADLGGCWRGRSNGGGNCCLPGPDLEILLELPGAGVESRLQRGRLRLLLQGSALTAALVLLLLYGRARVRAAGLGAELLASGERVRSLEFLSRLAAGLAHETKNPLGAVRGFAELLMRRALPEEEVHRSAARIVDETERIAARLDEFMLLSRPGPPRPVRFGLLALLRELGGLIGLELAAKGAAISVGGEEAEVTADQEQVRRLFLNLLVNAADALGRGGRVTMTVRRDPAGVAVVVADDGAGVPEPIRSTLFEPYVTGRAGGTGLGLAIVRRIASAHGWTVRYEPGVEPGAPRGTRMVVEIPAP